MVEKRKRAGPPQDAEDLAPDLVGIVDVLHHRVGVDEVDRLVLERQRLGHAGPDVELHPGSPAASSRLTSIAASQGSTPTAWKPRLASAVSQTPCAAPTSSTRAGRRSGKNCSIRFSWRSTKASASGMRARAVSRSACSVACSLTIVKRAELGLHTGGGVWPLIAGSPTQNGVRVSLACGLYRQHQRRP